jgi:hypothetical protein
LFLSIAVKAQKEDSVKQNGQQSDTTWRVFRPTGIKIGTDLISIGKTLYVKSFSGWEVNAETDFSRYYLAVDYGTWARTYFHPDDSAKNIGQSSYSNTGRYYRIGIDVNFLKKDPEKNVFFIGFRYGHSRYSEHFSSIENDPFIPDPNLAISKNLSNVNAHAHWLELTSGLRVKMWRFIWMGYTARFKFALKTKGEGDLLTSDVPGYGRTDKQTFWGFNYQLFFRIPVQKKK